MKVKLPSAEKSRRAMPWSKIVKRHLPANQEIKRYVLEKVTPPSVHTDVLSHIPTNETSHEETESPDVILSKALFSFEKSNAPPPTFDEQEYTRGFTEGEAKGFTEGEAKGFAEGETKGFTEGEAKGFAEGATKGFTEGEAKGFTEGERVGKEIREEELREFEQTHQLLLRLIEDMKDFTETVIQESENDVLQIALSVAQKILRKELSQDPEIIFELVQAALKSLAPIDTALIRIAPQDVEMLTRKRPELLAAVEGITFLKIEPDSRLLRGDCIVETPNRIVDTRPDIQLAEIKNKLLPGGEG